MTSRSEKSAQTLLLLALMISEITGSFEAGMMYAALPTMNKVYGDPSAVGWLITAFLLVGAASAAICGRLGDIFGRSRVLILMLALAGLGSLISALAPSLEWVIFGRALQGLSQATFPLAVGIVRERLPEHRVPIGVSYVVATATISAGLGVMLGGAVIDHAPWQWLFYISTAMAAVSVAMTLAFVPPSPRGTVQKNLDMVGGVLFVPAIAMVLVAISRSKVWGWGSPLTLGLLLGGLALLVIWTYYEWKHENPLINVRLLVNRKLALTNVSMLLFGLGSSQMMLVLVMLLQQPTWTGIGLGLSATIAGATKLPSNVMSAITGPLGGHFASRHGARLVLISGCVIYFLTWLALTLSHDNFWAILAIVIVWGTAGGLTYPAISNLIVESVPANRTSEAIGVATVIRSTAAGIGNQLIVTLLATATIVDASKGSGVFPTPGAYGLTLSAITLVALLAVLVAYAIPKGKGFVGSKEQANAAGMH